MSTYARIQAPPAKLNTQPKPYEKTKKTSEKEVDYDISRQDITDEFTIL